MRTSTCITCGVSFDHSRSDAKYCSRKCRGSCHRVRDLHRSNHDLRFIGVDGEGVDRPNGDHDYVMLSVGAETLFNNGFTLDTLQVFDFLWKQYLRDSSAVFIGFYLSYDFIQWQKGLPEDVARLLLTAEGIASRKSANPKASPIPVPVVWRGWEFDILAGRRFKLRPHVCIPSRFSDRCRLSTCNSPLEFTMSEALRDPDNGSDWRDLIAGTSVRKLRSDSDRGSWLYICDTGPFWQTSFLNAINPKGWTSDPPCSRDEYNLIDQGKRGRGGVYVEGDTSYESQMRKYNVLENEILARITQRLNKGFMNPDITIRIPKADWYGPGRAAQIWLDMLSDRIADPIAVRNNQTRNRKRDNEYTLRNKDVYLSMPEWASDAFRNTYYGGWFEQFTHGNIGDVWEYDINSAYPYIIAQLPCLHVGKGHSGSYAKGIGNVPISAGTYTAVKVHVRGTNRYIGAVPFRTYRGNILRPHEAVGWYWLHEIESGIRAGLVDSYTTSEWVSYKACDCNIPFNPPDIGIERMYRLRLACGKNTPQGKAFKLVYNSAYGKTAQSIGTPKFANPLYASLITAGTRCMILDMIATHPKGAKSVMMVATDGVYFDSPHPTVRLSPDKLGAWDLTVKEELTQFMPGVYWDQSAREGNAAKLKSRGINANDLQKEVSHLDLLFQDMMLRVMLGEPYEWPSMQLPVRFLMDSAKLALQRGKWNEAGRVQHNAVRSISSNPESKRNPDAYCDPDSGILRTRPYDRASALETTYYPRTFGYREFSELERLFDEQINRDGASPVTDWTDWISENGRIEE
jgi:hypothetical protein